MQPTEPQDFSDIIGMIIAFIAVLYAIASTIFSLFKKKQEPTDEEVEENEERQKLLKELFEPFEEQEEEIEEEPVHHALPVPPPPPPAPVMHTEPVSKERWQQQKERFVFQPNMDQFRQRTAIEDRKLEVHLRSGDDLVSEEIKMVPKYEVTGKKGQSPVQKLLQNIPSKKAWIILSEIVGPPISTRKNKSQYW